MSSIESTEHERRDAGKRGEDEGTDYEWRVVGRGVLWPVFDRYTERTSDGAGSGFRRRERTELIE